ncbi:hypothetical protein B9Z55_003082 [Caenorhabditis nigoni]|uniref:EF-hand domain-containing protein n=1 Tax=Caenorhabditis nigoni TaxID=1611254 RepID=A0A2G5VNT7_9PELO|nr:hypothetical protein B9Z55_003082 [Caenorhabditis nigoni]
MSNISNQGFSNLSRDSGVYAFKIPSRRGSSTIELIVEKMPTVHEEARALDVEIPLEFRGRKYQNLLSKYVPGSLNVPELEGWRKTMIQLLHNMNYHIAPNPRNYILEEFKEFSRQQIEFFIDIYYSFKNAKSRFMGFKEFRYFMDTMKHVDTMTLVDIFDRADTDQDGELSAEEFLQLFRLSNNLEYSGSLSALRDIAHSVHADIKEDQNEPNTCSQCVKIVSDEDVLELTQWTATEDYYRWREEAFGRQDERTFFATSKVLMAQANDKDAGTKKELSFLLTLKIEKSRGLEATVVGFPDLNGSTEEKMNIPTDSIPPEETSKKKSGLLSRAKSWFHSKNNPKASKSSSHDEFHSTALKKVFTFFQ